MEKPGIGLRVLDLSGNGISGEGAEALARALKQNKSLRVLNLRQNGLQL